MKQKELEVRGPDRHPLPMFICKQMKFGLGCTVKGLFSFLG